MWVVTDVISAVTYSKDPQHYWYVVKKRMQAEGNEDVTNCYRLKIKTEDGKMRDVEVMTRTQLLRMLETLPSKKAEPFRIWIARLANERIEEIKNPSKGIDNAVKRWKQMGKSDEWISLRLKGISVRNLETQTLKEHGIEKPKDFAYFTDKTNVAVYGQKAMTLKAERGLVKRENLRDHSSGVELSLLALHENACAGGMKSANAYGKASVDKVYNAVGSIISNTKQALIFALGKEAVTA